MLSPLGYPVRRLTLLALLVIFLLNGCTPNPAPIPAQPLIATTVAAAPTATVTNTPIPTHTPPPTNTPTAAVIPRPTSTPRPTRTATPTPDPNRYYAPDKSFSFVNAGLEDWKEEDIETDYPVLLAPEQKGGLNMMFSAEYLSSTLSEHKSMFQDSMNSAGISEGISIKVIAEDLLASDDGQEYYRWEIEYTYKNKFFHQVAYLYDFSGWKMNIIYTRRERTQETLQFDQRVDSAMQTVQFFKEKPSWALDLATAAAATLPPTPTLPTDWINQQFIYHKYPVKIAGAFLDLDCAKANQRAGYETNLENPFETPSARVDKYCLLVIYQYSTKPGDRILDAELEQIANSPVIDQGQVQSRREPMLSYQYDRMRVSYFVPIASTSFTLLLPDGQKIPIPLTYQPPAKQPTLSPVPTFTARPADQTDRTAGAKFVDEHGVEMVYIPAGEFQMGNPPGESNTACLNLKSSDQAHKACSIFFVTQVDFAPRHPVQLDSFYIDTLEVTNARYAECVAAGVCLPPGYTKSATRPDYYGNPDFAGYPVIYVDWRMARAYCQWRGGDLPSEAQWEKAARGQDNRLFPWGDDLDGSKANFCDVNCTAEGGQKDLDDGYADTAPADSFPPGASPYGLRHMAGNVDEWILDEYSARYYEEAPTHNPVGQNLTGMNVIRGGSWKAYYIFSLWSFVRSRVAPQTWGDALGFRCARQP